MPQLTFEPYTSTKTSILFIQKKTKQEVEAWNSAWDAASRDYSALRTRVENILAVHDGKKNKDKLPSIKDMSEEEERAALIRLLINNLAKSDSALSKAEIIIKYREDLEDLCNYDKDTQSIFGFVNTWWVFGEVAKTLNYQIFMAEAENVGFKRSKRGEKPMPNDLFRVDADGNVIVDDGIEETILDYMRKLQWD